MGKTTRPFSYDLNHIPYNYTVEVTDRFKALNLIECLKNYGRRMVTLYRSLWSRPSPRKRNAKEKRKDILNWIHILEFQRIARRDKKAFLSDQGKEIEETNRMGKTRDLFKKIRDTKVAFHSKMGTIKDRNGMGLTEAEDIKKRWQEYTEELYEKIFMTQITTMVWSLT